MPRAFHITVLVVASVVGAGILAYLGWKDWADSRRGSAKGWRTALTLGALNSLSLSVVLFVGYATHNVLVGGDQGGSSNILLCIRSGNYLALAAVLAGLGGKGLGRSTAGGCIILFLWFGQGASL